MGKAFNLIMERNRKEMKSWSMWKGVLAEFVGTSILVLIGCGACIGKDWQSNTPTVVQISFTFGLVVATLVRCLGHVSGGHINPAVTLAMLVTRRMTFMRALFYINAQLAGSLVGCSILKGITPSPYAGDLGVTTISSEMDPFPAAVTVEGLITFILVLTIFASCDANRNDLSGSTPLSIGFAVVFCHMFAIKYTGSSLNPARSFGPAVVGENWDYQWVFWAGPIAGGIVAALTYEFLFASNASLEKFRRFLTAPYYDHDHVYTSSCDNDDMCRCDVPQIDESYKI